MSATREKKAVKTVESSSESGELTNDQFSTILQAINRNGSEFTERLDNVQKDIESFTGRVEKVEATAGGALDLASTAAGQSEANRLEMERMNKQLSDHIAQDAKWKDKLVSNILERREADDQAHIESEVERTCRELAERERNLVFYDIEEGKEQPQDYFFLRHFIKTTLDLGHRKSTQMKFHNAFRRGESVDDRPRALVVTLDSEEDMWMLIHAANKNDVGDLIKRDFPPEVEEARCKLERLLYMMKKGGATGLKLKYPAALWQHGKVLRDYYPGFRRLKCSTLTERRQNDEFDDLPDDLKQARARGTEVLRRERLAREESPELGGDSIRGSSRGKPRRRRGRGGRGGGRGAGSTSSTAREEQVQMETNSPQPLQPTPREESTERGSSDNTSSKNAVPTEELTSRPDTRKQEVNLPDPSSELINEDRALGETSVSGPRADQGTSTTGLVGHGAEAAAASNITDEDGEDSGVRVLPRQPAT